MEAKRPRLGLVVGQRPSSTPLECLNVYHVSSQNVLNNALSSMFLHSKTLAFFMNFNTNVLGQRGTWLEC